MFHILSDTLLKLERQFLYMLFLLLYIKVSKAKVLHLNVGFYKSSLSQKPLSNFWNNSVSCMQDTNIVLMDLLITLLSYSSKCLEATIWLKELTHLR